MNCDNYKEQIPLLITGDLSQEDTAKLRAHLEQCDACGKEYEELHSMISQLDSHEPTALSAGEKAELQQRILNEMSHTNTTEINSSSSIPRRLIQSAAAVIIFASGYLIGYSLHSTESNITPATETAMAEYIEYSQKDNFTNYRLTTNGLKLIARGKKHLTQ